MVPCNIPGITVTVGPYLPPALLPGGSGGFGDNHGGSSRVGGGGTAGRGEPVQAGFGLSSCQVAGLLFVGNVIATGVTVGWLVHALRARRVSQLAGAPPALYSAVFRENVGEVFAVNLATPGGVFNAGSGGVTVVQDFSWLRFAKATAGFFPVVGMFVAGYDMLDVCGMI